MARIDTSASNPLSPVLSPRSVTSDADGAADEELDLLEFLTEGPTTEVSLSRIQAVTDAATPSKGAWLPLATGC
jgi:hypothetical protein